MEPKRETVKASELTINRSDAAEMLLRRCRQYVPHGLQRGIDEWFEGYFPELLRDAPIEVVYEEMGEEPTVIEKFGSTPEGAALLAKEQRRELARGAKR